MVFFGFANGGIFAAIGKDSHPVVFLLLGFFVFLLLGFFVCLLPVLFCVIDARSRNLLEMTKPGLIKYRGGPACGRASLHARSQERQVD